MTLNLRKILSIDVDKEDEEEESLLDLVSIQEIDLTAAQPPEVGQPLNLSAAPQEISIDEPLEVQPPPITVAQEQDALEESLEGNLTLGEVIKFEPFKDLGFKTDEEGKPLPVEFGDSPVREILASLITSLGTSALAGAATVVDQLVTQPIRGVFGLPTRSAQENFDQVLEALQPFVYIPENEDTEEIIEKIAGPLEKFEDLKVFFTVALLSTTAVASFLNNPCLLALRIAFCFCAFRSILRIAWSAALAASLISLGFNFNFSTIRTFIL